jgi:hypothetical protein
MASTKPKRALFENGFKYIDPLEEAEEGKARAETPPIKKEELVDTELPIGKDVQLPSQIPPELVKKLNQGGKTKKRNRTTKHKTTKKVKRRNNGRRTRS